MAIQGPGTPLKIGQDQIWRGKDKTNGFLMRNVDGRIPALKESFSRVDIGAASVLLAAGAIPYGNGLWLDLDQVDTSPGAVQAQAPTNGVLTAIAEFNQGWQTGHPVQGWGVPQYGRADMIRAGYVGYKVAMTAIGQEDNYLAYLQGNKAQDVAGVRSVYSDWITAWKAGANGARLALFFGNVSGFPLIQAIALNAGALPNPPTLAGATFAGWIEIWEPENEAVFVKFNL